MRQWYHEFTVAGVLLSVRFILNVRVWGFGLWIARFPRDTVTSVQVGPFEAAIRAWTTQR